VGTCWGRSPAGNFTPAPEVSRTIPTSHQGIGFTVQKEVILYNKKHWVVRQLLIYLNRGRLPCVLVAHFVCQLALKIVTVEGIEFFRTVDSYLSSDLILNISQIGSERQFRNFLRFSNIQISGPKVHPNNLLVRVEEFRNFDGFEI
jgi:hypothetical protein